MSGSDLAPLATACERTLKALDDLGLSPQDEPSRCGLITQLFRLYEDGRRAGLTEALGEMRAAGGVVAVRVPTVP